jgi:hypothetical protein
LNKEKLRKGKELNDFVETSNMVRKNNFNWIVTDLVKIRIKEFFNSRNQNNQDLITNFQNLIQSFHFSY